MLQSVLDMFSAGMASTSAGICWVLIYMALFPSAQARIQQEIDEAIGRERLPSATDSKHMPFTEVKYFYESQGLLHNV